MIMECVSPHQNELSLWLNYFICPSELPWYFDMLYDAELSTRLVSQIKGDNIYLRLHSEGPADYHVADA